ncbi:MAG TPA: glucoamylase family protein [Ferruginibacter sp.]|nr:glucoamylase family protein [Ferruginibacter sp.]
MTSKKTPSPDIFEILPQALASLKKNILIPFFGFSRIPEYASEKAPFRAELYTEEQLALYAKTLAKNHAVVKERLAEHLLKRLAQNEDILMDVHGMLTQSVKQNHRVVPAGEWLLDNFYLIEEQVYIGKKHLPKKYSKGLPQLINGDYADYPRVYHIAVEIISHTDGRVNLKSLVRFIKSYQTVTSLKIGELWAIPIMLRLALIENLRRISIQIAMDIESKNQANYWAEELMETLEKDSKNLVLVIADMARAKPTMDSSFVAEFTRKLQEKGTRMALPLNWLEQQLGDTSYTIAEMVHLENQKQAADQLSISNSISSLRFLNTNDWREFVEETSLVEDILKKDAVYPFMDFSTRDHYRHSVERIANKSLLSEIDIANKVIELACVNTDAEQRKNHVGYYLVDKGVKQVEKFAKVKLSFSEQSRKVFNALPLSGYTGGIFILSLLLSFTLFIKLKEEAVPVWMMMVTGVICLIGVSQLAFSIINWITTLFARPCLLPKMDFSKGIPPECKTMVVIPTIISSTTDVDELAEDLQVRYLANRHEHLHFALLTDLKDAKEEILPGDEELRLMAAERIKALNQQYGENIFFLFHRGRKWNKKEKLWMGYERKRGKLASLNRLILHKEKNDFSVTVGDEAVYSAVKYVITLDTDTQLPRDAAIKMIGTMAHPLNHPLFSHKKKRVTDGYTVLQPRVSNTLPGQNSSIFARVHSNDEGTDPYTRAVSDVYQDLFKEGSFIGKGIYDVAAFEQALQHAFPENRILSHDLLEGSYARAGLLTDVQLYEEYPAQYSTDIQRRHRWIRGDWQIAAWVLPFVPAAQKQLRRNPISNLSKWKIFDNLRRSLVPISYLLLLLYAWLFSPAAWFWTLVVTAIILLPSLISLAGQILSKPKDEVWKQHILFSLRTSANQFIQHILTLICLPYEAFINADAIVKTLWRVYISQKNLLQWNPFGKAGKNAHSNIAGEYIRMWFPVLLSLSLSFYLFIYNPVAFAVALPFLILWFTSPYITRTISFPVSTKKAHLEVEEIAFLYKTARKIWFFFETFVNKQDNWLPPDNYQETPVERIAHRTSPTNIGMSMLSNLGAYDFGYITAGKVIERTLNTFTTLDQMDKYENHLYNWYDTLTLQPLNPRYISTVDSGNFAGHIITLKQGIAEMRHHKIIPERYFEGLLDTIRIMNDQPTITTGLQTLELEVEGFCRNKPTDLPALRLAVEKLHTLTLQLNMPQEAWVNTFTLQVKDLQQQLDSLIPWSGNMVEAELNTIPTYNELFELNNQLLKQHTKNNTLYNHLVSSQGKLTQFFSDIDYIQAKCDEYSDIHYRFLYDKSQNLLAIGYNVDEQRRDNSYYDLLASEARLAAFVGIAQGKIPQESWFALGRQLTNAGSMPVLLSWSGSMFEYLMPMLVMPTYENTLLDQTCKAVVQKQIDYGKKRNVPWGISESGYNMFDAVLNYQYRAFGVPGLGFKRGLGEDLVVSPYSTLMSLMVSPEESYKNLQLLKENGFEGKYGFYEAVDYTAARLPRKKNHAVIQSFMAHHQGMSFLSLAYLLLDRPMQKRFEADVQVKTTLLLLQERIPRVTSFYSPSVHVADAASIASLSETPMRIITTPDTPVPEVQLLSNGNYNVMVTNAGSGYSRWKSTGLTRWRQDSTCDNTGSFCYIRDLDNDAVWSNAYQPSLKKADSYEAVFSQGKAEFRRKDFSLETHTEIVVSPEDDIELRRIHITNRSRKSRNIEIISYAEVVLAVPMADELHPAFSKLFIETEIVQSKNAILCSRRPRSENEKPPFMFHLMKVQNAKVKDISYETDRSRFIGRGRNIHEPAALDKNGKLTGTEGAVLDPIVAIKYSISIEPGESVIADIIYGIADTKENCSHLVNKYQDRYMTSRVIELSWTHSQVILRQINAMESDAQLYAKLASSIIFPNASLRADTSIILKNYSSQSGLWGYSISGDLPIVLVMIEDSENIDLVKHMVQAHAYWRLKGLIVDLVIINDDHGGYRQALQNEIMSFIIPGISNDIKDKPGGIFIRSADQVSNEDRILFQTVAVVVITDSAGSLEEQVNRKSKAKNNVPYIVPVRTEDIIETPVAAQTDLAFFNGIGGFAKDGREYIINTSAGQTTPAPWVNVLANNHFGCIISESGQSYTWVENAHELRLTPWNNDPVCDLQGEAFYIRDEISGTFWSPAPLPCKTELPYVTKHGFGYSTFLHAAHGIESNMTVFTHLEESIKFISIKIKNCSKTKRKLSVTGYMEWVLGDLRSKSIMHVITEAEPTTGAILASNKYNTALEGRVAFFDADDSNRNYTTDRSEFIGRNGRMSEPDAMKRGRLSGKTGAALDPCAAIQIVAELGQGEEKEIIFRLGTGRDRNQAITMIRRFEGKMTAQNALKQVKDYWQRALTTLQVTTPDNSINFLVNGWLNYQTLASRIWARSGFYQSGGAFGFRDQLQDILSLMYAEPTIARKQILLCASRQFKKGDVQHWWHPPLGRGVRTTCSDDYLWLPFVTCRYVEHTEDEQVWNEPVHYLEGRWLNAGEESYYDLPIRSDETGTVYEHCVKAIQNGFSFGVHGLPLMGSGDWNDGMDKVGEHGKGESVWLAFFLYDILIRFIEVATNRNDTAFVNECKTQAENLKNNIQQHAWDGKWFKRAFFDDGTPLGSHVNDECKIDSIAQSWSVLSTAGDEQYAATAMESAYTHLVRKEEGIIQLFNPPFDKSQMNPGYIKGYVPGVRENGGQYTHAAVWLTMAYAALGDKKRTWELLQMINPINHGNNAAVVSEYKVEPYVIAADVYAQPLHKGRGGWTWYTGSAGWFYQLITEWFIGIKKKGNTISFNPCLPEEWEEVKIDYRHKDTIYHISYQQKKGNGNTRLLLNKVEQEDDFITLKDDGADYDVEVIFYSTATVGNTAAAW